MGIDVDCVVAKESIKELEDLLISKPHGKREEIADDIIMFVEYMKQKYKLKK